jgi:hypothetical protein
MIRRVALAGILTAGLLTPLAITTPVGAGSDIGCSGNACSVVLSRFINLYGDHYGPPSAATALAVTVPPCLWEPIGDAVTGSQYIIQNFGAIGPNSYFGVTASVQLAKKLLKENPPPPGTWYELPTNPKANQQQQQVCRNLPLFSFQAPGQAPPGMNIQPLTLAQYAYNNMVIPHPAVHINPAGKGYVNLATFAWADWPLSRSTNTENGYRVIATLNPAATGQAETVTVWARPSGFAVSVTGPPAFTPYSANCGLHGSAYPRRNSLANAGAGTPPDCGVLWQGPGAGAVVKVTETWSVSWGVGQLNGPGPHQLPAISLTGSSNPIQVMEIQSVNGG